LDAGADVELTVSTMMMMMMMKMMMMMMMVMMMMMMMMICDVGCLCWDCYLWLPMKILGSL
jgi:hypothetical protein